MQPGVTFILAPGLTAVVGVVSLGEGSSLSHLFSFFTLSLPQEWKRHLLRQSPQQLQVSQHLSALLAEHVFLCSRINKRAHVCEACPAFSANPVLGLDSEGCRWRLDQTNISVLSFQACSGRPPVVLVPPTSGIPGSRATAPPCGKRGEAAEDRERGEEQAQVWTLFLFFGETV